VPKHNVDHPVGSPITEELQDLLTRYFSERDISKLERLGGRVTISLTAPYVSKEQREKYEVILDDNYVEKLRSMRHERPELESELKKLSVKQMRALGKVLGHPLRSTGSRQQHLSELVNHFLSEEVWNRISGSESRD
jgi:hypothetical protein